MNDMTQFIQKKSYEELLAFGSPAYFFDEEQFVKRTNLVRQKLQGIPLTYSMKANPFLLDCLPDEINKIEVCSPGELHICKARNIDGDRIIYSGVNKELWDVKEAVAYGVCIMTAESLQQLELENQAVLEYQKAIECQTSLEDQAIATKKNKSLVEENCRTEFNLNRSKTKNHLNQDDGIKNCKKNVILRLASGNQFGMSEEEIENILSRRSSYQGLNIIGFHYYSGTQKKIKNISKDLLHLSDFLRKLEIMNQFQPELVEYGPGIGAQYFLDSMENCEEKEMDDLNEVASLLWKFAEKYPLGVEMGRFLAAPCGTYVTQVKDVKSSYDTNYLILDGGIHQLKYYGQTMAMQVPQMTVRKKMSAESVHKSYMLCGSLCTTADVLVSEVCLPEMEIGDYLMFHRCGAYSVTEGAVSFLSRTMPRIYIVRKNDSIEMVRDFMETSDWNQKRNGK